MQVLPPSITGKTQLLGVIGWPIAHSLSPLMHNAAIAQLGVDYVYVPLAVAPERLAEAVVGFEAMGLRGFNITIPHKQAMLPLLTEVTAVAQAVGAVNTVWRTAAGWSGTNTDVAGFLAPLQAMGRDWGQTDAVVLGNGGAARAVVAGCAQLGCRTIGVVGRDRQKLAQFQQSWAAVPGLERLQVQGWDAVAELLPTAGLVVNTTPIGMAPQAERSPLSPTEIALLPPQSIVYDLIYVPQPTVLLQQAQARGLVALDGLEMLVQQGAAALRIWLEREVPVAVMRQTLQQHLAKV
jgi:shikimate dehydrogenase